MRSKKLPTVTPSPAPSLLKPPPVTATAPLKTGVCLRIFPFLFWVGQPQLEEMKVPAELDYDSVPGLSFEVRQKLKSISPETIGQASRISGVTPAAVSLLLVHLKRRYYYVKDKGTQAKEKGNV